MAKVPTLLTVRELARLSGVTRTTACRWIDKGAIVHFRTPGNQIRIPVNQPYVLSLLASRGIVATSQESLA